MPPWEEIGTNPPPAFRLWIVAGAITRITPAARAPASAQRMPRSRSANPYTGASSSAAGAASAAAPIKAPERIQRSAPPFLQASTSTASAAVQRKTAREVAMIFSSKKGSAA